MIKDIRKTILIFSSLVLLGGLVFSYAQSTTQSISKAAGTLNTFTVGAPKQTIKGFGVSSVQMAYANRGYNVLTQAQKLELDTPLLNDIKINTMRYWGNISNFADTYGAQYNNIKQKVNRHLFQAEIRDNNMNTEPMVVAQGIKNLKDNNNILITHVSICNECSTQISLNNWPQHVINLRNALDSQGLQNVLVVAAEGPNNDGFWMDRLQAIRNNPTAWAALGVISSHSYSMALRPEDEAFKTGSGKEWWIGESSDNGSESLGDANAAATAIARTLHDFNSGADNWIWFIGHAPADNGDDKTRMIRYWESPFRSEKLEKFYYFKQFRDIFQDGTRIHDTVSDLEGKMPWTYQNYANMQSVAGQNPDGSWSLGVVNYSNSSLAAKFKITQLAGQPNLSFDVFRSNGADRGTKIATATMVNGEVNLPSDIGSKEFITLKSTNNTPVSSSSSLSSVSSVSSSTPASSSSSQPVSSQTSSQTSGMPAGCLNKSTGAIFGASPSLNNNPNLDYNKVFDNDTSTFFDYANPNGGFAGMDLGQASVINKVCAYPRSLLDSQGGSLIGRFEGIKIQGSNDNNSYTDLTTLTGGVLNQWKEVSFANNSTYRYYRFLSPDGGYGNLAELRFIQDTSPTIPTSGNLRVKLNLQGSYNTATNLMKTDLKNKNLISSDNPYDDSIINNPSPIGVSNAVDWVQVIVQNTQNPNIISFDNGGLLLSNGEVLFSGNSTKALTSGKYKVTIRHRNHLAIATDTDIDIASGQTTLVDFTTNQNVKGGNQAMIQPGIYGLKMGNTNSNDRINSQDRIALRLSPDKTNVYSPLDINMDGNISSLDRILNRSVGDSVEKI